MTRAALVALTVVIAACTSPAIAPTASPPAPTRYVNDMLGFALTLPPLWRVSECLSGVTRSGSYLGQDVLTTRTAAEEHDLGAGGDTGGTGALTWVIAIAVETSSLSPTEYATARGGSIGDKLESTTIDGRPAIRLVDGAGRALTYYVANASRMYTINLSVSNSSQPQLATDATLERIARSMTFSPPTARPTPTPVPQLSPAVETLVDAVATAFAASDADRLRELMPPKCWFSSAGYQSSGTSVSREAFAESLRSSFSNGLRVTVESRPIKTDAAFIKGPFWVRSSWSAYDTAPLKPQTTVQLVFDQVDGRWYWIGALFNAPR